MMSHPAGVSSMRDHYSAAAARYRRDRSQIRAFFGAVFFVLMLAGAMSAESCMHSPQPAVRAE